MQVVLMIISLGLLGVIIYFAVSSKSSRFLKLAALIALGLIVISLGVASVFLALNVSKQNEINEEAHLPVFLNPPEPPSNKGNIIQIIVFLVFFVLIMGFIAIIAYKDNKKRQSEAQKVDHSHIFPNGAEDLDVKADEPHDKPKEDDGGFNLNID